MPSSSVMISPNPLPVSLYMGPVHGKPEKWGGYITVRVPSYWKPGWLCWVNVAKDDIAFADKVPDEVVEKWRETGWTNSIRRDPIRALL